jgi:hypothetical protein
MSRLFHRIRLARFLVLIPLAALMPSVKAQSQEIVIQGTAQTVPVCKVADLDSNVSFFNANTYSIVAFDLQNVSERPCVPQPSVAFPQFDAKQLRDTKPFDLCIDCEDRLPNGRYRGYDPMVLNPGELAHQAYQWKTVAPNETIKCLQLAGLFAPVLVAAPTLLKPVCSEIAISRTYAGAFVPPAQAGQTPADESQGSELLTVSSSKRRYYQDEMFNLHVGLVSPPFQPPSGEECPVLFLRERSPDGGTRLDAVQPSGFKTCKSFWLNGNRNADWQSGFEVDSGAIGRWVGFGEHSFELFLPVSSSRDGTTQFVHSNKLIVQIDDSALISRKWNGKTKGVGVDVTLDKDAYQLGEDVPLHIAIENFDAPVPIYAIDPRWDPYPAIDIEVHDASGRLLGETERYSHEMIWLGHGSAPVLYDRGKLVPIERTLESQGWLPNRPGVYSVAVRWCTLDGTNFEPSQGISLKDDRKIYGRVEAVATFRVSETLHASQCTLPDCQK